MTQPTTIHPPLSPNRRPTPLVHIGVLLVYSLLALLATMPLVQHLTTHLPAIPSEAGHDVWQHVWNIWWVQRALLLQPTNPFQTDMIFYPHGTSLWLHSLNLPLALPALLLLPLLGQVATYNTLTLLVLVLVGYSSFLLAQQGVRQALPDSPAPVVWAAALVGGAVVLCSPQRLIELRQAHLAAVSDYAVPLLFLVLPWALRRQTWRAAVLVALVVLLGGLSKWYNLFYSMLALLPLLIGALWVAWREQRLPTELLAWSRIGLVCALVVAPFLLPGIIEARTASYDTPTIRGADLLLLVSTGWHWILRPVPPDWWEPASFAILALLLAGVGVLAVPRATRLWWVTAIWCFVLALGPAPNIGMHELPIPLPYALLQALPVVDLFRVPYRMNAITTMMLSVLAAVGVAALLRRVPQQGVRLAPVVAVVLCGMLLLEAARLPFPLVAAEVSPFYRQIAAEPGAWSLLELPVEREDRQFLEMYTQTFHGHAILTGKTSRDLPRLPYEAFPTIASINRGDSRRDIVSLPPATETQLWQALRPRYLVLHRSQRTPQRTAAQADAARKLLGAITLVYSDTLLEAYRIEPLAAWLATAGAQTRVPVPLFIGLGRDWQPLEQDTTRWLLEQSTATVLAYTPQPALVALDITMHSLGTSQPLEIWLNGQYVQTVEVTAGAVRRYRSAPLALPIGASRIELRATGTGVAPAALGISSDPRLLVVNVQRIGVQELLR